MGEELSPTMVVGQVELILVPPGAFIMGSDEGEADEKPSHEVSLDAFYIGRYPVTNAQYRRFEEATGRTAPRHWSGGSIPEGKEDHPVVYVDWHDARAYCQWLTDKRDQVARLPTEAEWEKAARGTDGLMYPWGDEFDKSKCNTEVSGIRDTTPVGKYSSQGDSPYGIADMVGNVWEWTSSQYFQYPYKPDDGRENPKPHELPHWRVARGAAFSTRYGSGDVRCTYRSATNPDHPGGHRGFRVVVSHASPKPSKKRWPWG